MSPERDEPTEDQEQELYEDVPPRSIFAATWFRVVLVVIVLGVIGAVAVPYALDWMNPPPPPRTAATRVPGTAAPLPPSAFDRPAADKPAADKPVADKQDSTLIPAPAAPPTTPAPMPPARTDLKNEPKPGAPTAPKPPAQPKTTAKAAAPPAKPAPSETKGKSAAADSPAAPPATAKGEPKPATATKPSPSRTAATKAATPAAPAASGPFWVQVGAFKDPEAAKRLATKLRGENFQVEESVRRAGGTATPATTPAPKAPAAAPSGSDHYDVFVSGMSVEDLNKRLSGKGLAAETSGSGAVVKPSLPLRDAVALSKDLAVEGFKVQVRRAGGGTAATPAPPTSSAVQDGGTPLHRVRVGAFSDRTAAQAAARDLAAKGYKPFIARGDQ